MQKKQNTQNYITTPEALKYSALVFCCVYYNAYSTAKLKHISNTMKVIISDMLHSGYSHAWQALPVTLTCFNIHYKVCCPDLFIQGHSSLALIRATAPLLQH